MAFVPTTPTQTTVPPPPPAYSGFLGAGTPAELDVLADQLEVQLTGGQPSDDSPYDWRYLRLCVQQAYDFKKMEVDVKNATTLQADYLTRKKDEIESFFMDLKARTDYWESPERWVQAFAAPVLRDSARGEQYFVLPAAFIALRRYQNLPGEDAVRDVQALKRNQRGKYRFVYVGTGSQYHTRSEGGLLGCWGYYREQTMAGAAGEQHRCYLVPPKGCDLPDDVLLNQYLVLRDSRASGLPDPPVYLVEMLEVYRAALELAMYRTRQDRIVDSNPAPTQVQL